MPDSSNLAIFRMIEENLQSKQVTYKNEQRKCQCDDARKQDPCAAKVAVTQGNFFLQPCKGSPLQDKVRTKLRRKTPALQPTVATKKNCVACCCQVYQYFVKNRLTPIILPLPRGERDEQACHSLSSVKYSKKFPCVISIIDVPCCSRFSVEVMSFFLLACQLETPSLGKAKNSFEICGQIFFFCSNCFAFAEVGKHEQP